MHGVYVHANTLTADVGQNCSDVDCDVRYYSTTELELVLEDEDEDANVEWIES